MKCTKCKFENAESAKFCIKCGTRFPLVKDETKRISVKNNMLLSNRILLFILLVFIGVFVMAVAETYIGDLLILPIFALLYWSSLTVLLNLKLNSRNLLYPFIGWVLVFISSAFIQDSLFDVEKNHTTLLPAILASFIAVKTFNKKEIGRYGNIILGLGWGFAFAFKQWSWNQGWSLFGDGYGFIDNLASSVNIAFIVIIISVFVLLLQPKYK